MRIAVVSVPAVRKEPSDYVQAMAKGMTSMGHRVDILNGWTEDGFKLPGYEYVAVVTEPVSAFSGKIPTVISKLLAAGSSLSGKKKRSICKKDRSIYQSCPYQPYESNGKRGYVCKLE